MKSSRIPFPVPAFLAAALTLAVATAAAADTVKITPLGSHEGEFCPCDRAMILEDPDGTRLLYDAGRTVDTAPCASGDSRHVIRTPGDDTGRPGRYRSESSAMTPDGARGRPVS